MTTLSNWQCDQAETAGAGYQRYKRSSREAIEAYLETAQIVFANRPTCTKRGQWKEWLERSKIEDRTARYMITIARAGATVDDIEAAGGLRAFRESLTTPKAETQPEPGSGIEVPEPPATHAPTAAAPTVALPNAPAPDDTDQGKPLSPDARRRAEKRARGECIDCPNPSPDHARCAACRAKGSRRDKALRANARTGAALRARLEKAADRGTGLRITAEEVARILAA